MTRNRRLLVTSVPFIAVVLGFLLSCAEPPAPRLTLNDDSTLIYIPSGEFEMGAREGELEGGEKPNLDLFGAEQPLHRVQVGPFYLAQTEVTNAQYVRFYNSIVSGDSTLLHADHPEGLSLQLKHVNSQLIRSDRQPVVSVSWFGAYSYCKWAGGRLPTEAEWEYAARGRDGLYRRYPWGNAEPNSDIVWLANYSPQDGADMDGAGYTAPVGSFPDGASYFGILDMAGNAQEWVQDWFDEDYYSSTEGIAVDPQGPESGQYKVKRGGSYQSSAFNIRAAARAYARPRYSTALTGIRCARNP